MNFNQTIRLEADFVLFIDELEQRTDQELAAWFSHVAPDAWARRKNNNRPTRQEIEDLMADVVAKDMTAEYTRKAFQ